MKRKQKIKNIISIFENIETNPQTELKYKADYELAVAVILSAQCTDKRVNLITPNFFNRFPNFNSLSLAKLEEIFELIRSCSYPNNKTKHLLNLAKIVVDNYNSVLPLELNKLINLPGIGRKSANVLLSVLKNEPVLAVDTHVFRVSHRLGLVESNAKTPYDVEKQIVEIIENKKDLTKLHHWLILHGRYVCKARKPDCETCKLKKFCNYYQKINKTN